MPTLPIPMFGALVLGFLFVRLWVTEGRVGPLGMLLGLCAVQAVILSLAQHYRVPGMNVVQPITATLIPGMTWAAFQITAVRRFAPRDLLHLAGPVAAVACLVLLPDLLDLLIPGLFTGYGIAILWASRAGSDALPRMRIAAGDLPGRIWTIIGATLIASALSDVMIVGAQVAGAAWLQPWIISFYSSTILIVIGVLSLSSSLGNAPQEVEEVPDVPDTSAEDARIMADLEALMATAHPYLNPDLTVAQLSRKLRIPAKQLSGAVNRSTGENISRYINAARIRAAQSALKDGESVTRAMLDAGFNTKSNFNREFLRITGQSPSAWAVAARGAITGPEPG